MPLGWALITGSSAGTIYNKYGQIPVRLSAWFSVKSNNGTVARFFCDRAANKSHSRIGILDYTT